MSLSKGPTLNVGSKAAIPSVFDVIKTLTKPYTSHHHHHRNKIHLQTHTLPHLNSKSLTFSSSKPSHYQKQNLGQLTKSQNQSIQSRIVEKKTRQNRRIKERIISFSQNDERICRKRRFCDGLWIRGIGLRGAWLERKWEKREILGKVKPVWF